MATDTKQLEDGDGDDEQDDGDHSHCLLCLVFLHRVFANVSSNHMPERMQSHIDCIGFTLLHYVFLNVTSHDLPQRMHNYYTGCICWTFLFTVSFQMHP